MYLENVSKACWNLFLIRQQLTQFEKPSTEINCQIFQGRIGFLSSASKSLRMEQHLKVKCIESQPILACPYISIVILINAIKTPY